MKTKITIKNQKCDLWEIVECCTQGQRSSMEDSSALLYPFTSENSLFLSVFDGHAGSRCSHFLSNTLPSELRKETQSTHLTVPSKDIFVQVFHNTDEKWLKDVKQSPSRVEDGSTALCLALENDELVVANCGDSRAILFSAGQTLALTRDHIPTDEEERQRIVIQGGAVIGGRLQGQLGVSRAFGNYEFKESQVLSAEPEIHQVTLTSEAELLVVGSDGLYEHFTNEEIISYIKNGLLNSSLENVVKELVAEAMDRGSEDNITIIVVKFDKAFRKLLKKRAKKQSGGKPLVSGKSAPLRISAGKSTSTDPPPEPTKTAILTFKKGLNLKPSPKNSSISLLHHTNSLKDVDIPKKKESKSKLHKASSPRTEKPYDEDKWTKVKPFKHDFFGRTAVTILG